MYNCFVLVNNEQIDNCLVVRFQAPYSFTGENVVELHLHGNPFLVDLIIQIAVDYGARLAKPCLLYTSPSPRDRTRSRMPSSA